MLLGLSEPLRALVRRQYKIAVESGELFYSETSETVIIRTKNGIPFQLRYCPSLLQKPKWTPPETPGGKPYDPFDAPTGPLVVGHVSAAQPGDSAGDEARPPTHVIVLNRFPIIANHFILATMPFKPQDAPLDADDLAATHASIRAWEEQSGVADEAAEEGGPPRKPRLIAFFNMGPLSGASQPHRHVQFLPEEDVRAGMPADDDGASPPWRPLIDMLAGAETTATGAAAGHEAVAPPFVHFREALPRDASPAALHGAYARLLARTRAAWERRAGPSLGEPASRFSCNWAMVRDAVAMCPRTGEGASALDEPGARDGVGGVVAANGAVLVGALVVKRRPEWDVLRREPGALDRVLGGIGVPSASGKHFAESSI